MSLRRKTLVIIGVVLLSAVAIIYITSQTVLLASYEELEQQSARENVQRTLNALLDILDNLAATNQDYAYWDDTYFFMEDRNQDYIDTNFQDTTFTNLELNLLILVDPSGSFAYAKAVDLQTGQEIELPEGVDTLVAEDSPLIDRSGADEDARGVVVLPAGPMLISSKPILTSAAEGPEHGNLIFGVFLDEARVALLSESIRLPITVLRWDNPQLTSDFLIAQEALDAGSPDFVRPLDADRVAGYSLIEDLNSNPALLLSVEMPRDIYQQGRSNISFFVLLLVIVGLVFTSVTILLLERVVLSRLTALSRNVNQITSRSNIAGRVSADGDDELASLGSDINGMLSALEQSQRILRESDERLRTVVNSAPIMLWAVDGYRMLSVLEGKSLTTLGLKPDQAIGKSVTEVFRNIPHLVDEIERALGGETFSSVVPVSGLSFDVCYLPLRDSIGEVTGSIGVATDISQRVHMERALNETSESLEQKKRQLERVRSLFQSTLIQLSEAIHRGAQREELGEYLEFMQTQFRRLEQ